MERKKRSGGVVLIRMIEPHIAWTAPSTKGKNQPTLVAFEEVTINKKAAENAAPHPELGGNRRRLARPGEWAIAIRGRRAIPG